MPSNYLSLLIGSVGERTPKPLSEGKQSISAEAEFYFPEFYFISGVMRNQQLGQHSAAIADFDAAIRLKPDYAHAYAHRGIAKAELGQHSAAIADFDVAIRLKPDYALAYVHRGIAKAKLAQYSAAVADYDVAIRLKPNDAVAYVGRGLQRAGQANISQRFPTMTLRYGWNLIMPSHMPIGELQKLS